MEQEYNLYYKDDYVDTFTENQLAKRFEISTEEISDLADKKEPFNKVWRFGKIYNANLHRRSGRKKKTDNQVQNNNFPPELLEEWDAVTGPYRKARVM